MYGWEWPYVTVAEAIETKHVAGAHVALENHRDRVDGNLREPNRVNFN
jgi:hypothetical protein